MKAWRLHQSRTRVFSASWSRRTRQPASHSARQRDARDRPKKHANADNGGTVSLASQWADLLKPYRNWAIGKFFAEDRTIPRQFAEEPGVKGTCTKRRA